MRTQLLNYLACPNCETETPFDVQANASQDDGDIVSGTLTCQSCQCVYQIRDGIPRFVSLDQDYCSNFGFQWKRWRTLQIDRLSGHSLSTDRFFADSEWPPSSLEGKVVLDAGCGAGRFADVAAAHGATVIAVDLSDAIDACQETTSVHGGRVHCLQASLLNLPLRPMILDAVYCMGVIQHTPDPGAVVRSLPSHLKPGGQLAYNFYEEGIWRCLQIIKYALRLITPHLSVSKNLALSQFLVGLFFPLTRRLARVPKVRIINHFIPIASVHNAQLSTDDQRAWTLLDTLDWYGARYEKRQHHEDVATQLRDLGMSAVRSRPGLAWATKPEK